MRKITLIFTFLLTMAGLALQAQQTSNPAFTGIVRSGARPMVGLHVRIERIDTDTTVSLPGIDDFFANTWTDTNGRYWTTVPYVWNAENFYKVSVQDCDSSIRTQTVNITPNGGVVNFTLCQGPPPPPPACGGLNAGFVANVFGQAVQARVLHPLPGQRSTWDYGDGTIDSGLSCGHWYQQPGFYIICHTATLDTCVVTKCDTIFAGDSTLRQVWGNIYAGTTCVNGSVLVEFISVTANNYYGDVYDSACIYIADVPRDQYLIRATPVDPSLINAGYMPTYYGNTLTWGMGNIVNVTSNSGPLNINLIKADTILQRTQPGKIKVKLQGSGAMVESPIPNTPDRLYAPVEARIFLYTASGKTIGWTATGAVNDEDAEFTNLPGGTYKVLPDVPVIPSFSQMVTVTLGAAPAQATFGVSRSFVGPVSVTSVKGRLEGTLTAYPNPAGYEFTLSLSKAAGKGSVRLVSADGRTVATHSISDLSQPFLVPVGALKAGLYTAVITTDSNAQATVRVQVAR